jgi:hypothetical protein
VLGRLGREVRFGQVAEGDGRVGRPVERVAAAEQEQLGVGRSAVGGVDPVAGPGAARRPPPLDAEHDRGHGRRQQADGDDDVAGPVRAAAAIAGRDVPRALPGRERDVPQPAGGEQAADWR